MTYYKKFCDNEGKTVFTAYGY